MVGQDLTSWDLFFDFFVALRLLKEGSLNGNPFGGNQTMQMYGDFEAFPLNGALFGLVV